MPEAVANQLEQKRFVITPESLNAMKRVRDALPGLQEQYPFLSGVSFFGSRTKGIEHEGSDLDLRIFYDTSKSKDLTSTFGGLSQAVPHVKKDSKYELAGKISAIAGLNLDTSHDGWAVDISKERTDKYIEMFTEISSEGIGGEGATDDLIDHIRSTPPGQNLLGQFFLAIGDGVYANRAYILDQFSQVPHGEEYFQILMECLARMERASNHKYLTPRYEGLPKTINEARKYFLTKSNLSEEQSALAA